MAARREIAGVLVVHDTERLVNVPRIVDEMQKYASRIVVWDNCKRPISTADLFGGLSRKGEVDVLRDGSNKYLYGRFLACKQAERETVITCDDDVLVDNWGELIGVHRDTGRVACNLDPGHAKYAKTHYVHRYLSGVAYQSLVGYGAAFAKSSIGVLDKWIEHYGEDELLHRKADRIFTILQRRPHEMIVKDILHLPGATSQRALYRRKDHHRLTRLAEAKCIELLNRESGW